MLIPGVLFDKNNNEVFRDQSNNLTRHVHHWERMERLLTNLVKTLHSGDTFDDLQLVALFKLVGKNFAHAQVAIDLVHMVTKHGHLLGTNGVFVQLTVEDF